MSAGALRRTRTLMRICRDKTTRATYHHARAGHNVALHLLVLQAAIQRLGRVIPIAARGKEARGTCVNAVLLVIAAIEMSCTHRKSINNSPLVGCRPVGKTDAPLRSATSSGRRPASRHSSHGVRGATGKKGAASPTSPSRPGCQRACHDPLWGMSHGSLPSSRPGPPSPPKLTPGRGASVVTLPRAGTEQGPKQRSTMHPAGSLCA